MILSNVELQKALDSRRVVITPEPKPRQLKPDQTDDYCPFDTHSVDLTLGNEITEPEDGVYAFDLTRSRKALLAPFIQKNSKKLTIADGTQYTLKSNKFVLAQTRENVELPIDHPENIKTQTCLSARIEGKSSRARIGLLVHFVAVHSGRLTSRPVPLTACLS
jgi:dCTP deaminase